MVFLSLSFTALFRKMSFPDVLRLLDSPAGQVQASRMAGTVIASLICAGFIVMAGGLAWALVLNTMRQFPGISSTIFA